MLYGCPRSSVPTVAITGTNSSSIRPLISSGLILFTSPTNPSAGSRGDGLDQPGVLPAHTDRIVAVDVDGGDELRVHLADQHHSGDVDRLGIGDAQAVAEHGLLAQPRHQGGDLRTTAVDHDRPHADEPHQHDVLGEQGEGVVGGRPSEGVASVLDHDHLAGESTDVRQRLDQRRRLQVRRLDHLLGGRHGISPTVASPAVSDRPRATLAACIAPPLAPLVRLSRAASTTT